MKELTEKKYYTPPADDEKVSAIINATCQHFEVDEELLINSKCLEVVTMRQLAIYLIARNTTYKDYMIGERLKITRNPVNYAISKIDTHRIIYGQTLDSLNAIITIANNFEKKYQWHLPQVNTRH